MAEVVGFKPVTEHKLQFAPRWIIDKAIHKERQNYVNQQAFVPVSIKSIPRSANVITSHHFFRIKKDGEEDKLKLKCRHLPHGNRDAEKDNLRTDSSTAQFTPIRTLCSIAALLRLKLAALDFTGSYLQAGELLRDIFMRPPKGWRSI